MGLFTKVEDRPTPASVYNWRVYAVAAVAGSAAVMIGCKLLEKETHFKLDLANSDLQMTAPSSVQPSPSLLSRMNLDSRNSQVQQSAC